MAELDCGTGVDRMRGAPRSLGSLQPVVSRGLSGALQPEVAEVKGVWKETQLTFTVEREGGSVLREERTWNS